MPRDKKPSTPSEYLAALSEPRHTELESLDAAIRQAAPKLKSYVAYVPRGAGGLAVCDGNDFFRVGVERSDLVGVETAVLVAVVFRVAASGAAAGTTCATTGNTAEARTKSSAGTKPREIAMQ